MRFFPGALRVTPAPGGSRWLTCLLLAVVTVAFLAVPTATAEDRDDLRHKQREVRGQINRAAKELHQSSKKVTRLTVRLEKARTELRSARRQLTRVSGRLETARSKSELAKKQLQAAQRRLDLAAAELTRARKAVAAQQRALRGEVVRTATDGDKRLEAVTAILNAGSLEELMLARTMTTVMVAGQYRSLTGLEQAEAAMKKQKDKVETARDKVAQRKRAAQAQLRRTKTLFQQAAATKRRVNSLVSRTSSARRAAARARAEDEEALRRLRARERAIKRKLLASAGGDNFTGSPNGMLRVPVDNGYITSGYGWRTHPIYGYRSFHNGVDFGSGQGCGSQLIAGAGGRVVASYFDEIYGRRLYINIGRVNGAIITLVYNHASGYRVGVGSGVARGDVVGWMGTTGWSTGCHLHFTVLRNGEPVNPMGYL